MEKELREQCHRGARHVLAQRSWALVQDEAAFVEEVLAEVQFRIQNSRRPLAKIIEDATVNRYGHLWHAACGADGTLRQRQALRELHRYLYPIALYCAGHDQHIAEESTQEALISAWQHLDQVLDPGSFASWARTIVSRLVKAEFRKQSKRVVEVDSGEVEWQAREISETDLRVRGGAESTERETWGIGGRLDLSASQEPRMTDEIRARLEVAIRHCLRSKQQQAVIIGLFLDHKTFKEMADELDKTPQNVYVLKTRALGRLRECEHFLDVLEDLL